jgi:hypothetical protein
VKRDQNRRLSIKKLAARFKCPFLKRDDFEWASLCPGAWLARYSEKGKNVGLCGTIKGSRGLIVPVWRRFSGKRVSPWPGNSCVVSDNKGWQGAYCPCFGKNF